MIGKILTRLFALFGMTLTCVACYGTPYDEYHPEWSVSGRVVDISDGPIEGIKVSSRGHFTTSESDGRFWLHGNGNEIYFEDVDGEANGGEFESHMIDLNEHMGGNMSGDVGNVTLSRKESDN